MKNDCNNTLIILTVIILGHFGCTQCLMLNIRYFVKAGWIWTADIFTLSSFFFWENIFEELDEDNGRMEVKEYCQWKCDPLNDDPRHEAVEVSLDKAGPHLLNLEWNDKPLCKV